MTVTTPINPAGQTRGIAVAKKKFQLIALIARKNADGSVSVFDTDGTQKATFDRDLSNKPTRRNKYVTLNCFRYALTWEPATA